MSAEQLLSLSKNELEILVRKKLDYLIAEGMVIQIGNKYRLKTQKEINNELDFILSAY
jgi:hypothetical protein